MRAIIAWFILGITAESPAIGQVRGSWAWTVGVARIKSVASRVAVFRLILLLPSVIVGPLRKAASRVGLA